MSFAAEVSVVLAVVRVTRLLKVTPMVAEVPSFFGTTLNCDPVT